MSTRRVWVRALCLLFLTLLLPASALAAPFLPSGLLPGQLYHLMFLTRGGHDAFSSDITVYNAFVNAEAALNPSLTGTDVGIGWSAIASTAAVDARDNALVSGPVYRLNGEKFKDNFAQMWNGLATGKYPNIDQFGVVRPENPLYPGPWVWTGSDVAGVELLGLGSSGDSWAGRHDFVLSDWISWGHFPNHGERPLYALSQPIKAAVPPPVAEPVTLVLLTAGVGVWHASGNRQRRRAGGPQQRSSPSKWILPSRGDNT
jgi:hypothetical protein